MTTLKYLHSEITKIKNNKDSFLGMDGGNIHSKLWFCGLEFGADLLEMEDYYSNFVHYYEAINFRVPYRTDCPERYMKSTFDRYLALMYSILTGDNENPKKEKLDDIVKNKLYHQDSKTFKVNLFPIAKKDTSWNKEIETHFSISKTEYYGSIFENRISFIQKLVGDFNPKTILCFSPKGHSEFFIDTFVPDKKWVECKKDSISLSNGRTAKIMVFKFENHQVIIIPFLGRGNLHSHDDIKKISRALKKII